jgi:serine/threonine protein kinase
MEKSLSAPQQRAPEPKTVSGKTLSTRTLHPVFAASYTLGDELGSGGFGFVVGAHRNFDGRPVAVKFIWKNKVPSHGWVRDPTMGVIPLEAFVLRVVDHPCVVKFIDLFDDDEFFYLVMEMHGTPWKAPEVGEEAKPEVPSPESTSAVLPPKSPGIAIFAPGSLEPCEASMAISTSPEPQQQLTQVAPQKAALAPPQRPAPMERRTSRDLFECIEQHTRFSEDVASWIFAQIVEAVYYLGQLGICHRDIKDENCVIDSDWNVKIIDFGSAVISDPRKPAPYFDRFFGTMTFASSEILQGRQYRAPHAEVWSLGVLLSILLSGECPFSEPAAAVKGRISSRVKNSWSAEAYNLLCGCVQVDPERRATIAQVRDHPWVRRAWERKGLRRPSAPQIF